MSRKTNHLNLLCVLLVCASGCSTSGGDAETFIEPPRLLLPDSEVPNVLKRDRVETTFSSVADGRGAIFVVEKTLYEDRFVSQGPSGIWFQTPFPLEVIFVDDFVPPSRKVFYPEAPESVRHLSVTPGQTRTRPKIIAGTRFEMRSHPSCLQREYRAVARLKGGDFAKMVPEQDTTDSIFSEGRFSDTRSQFSRELNVCIKIVDPITQISFPESVPEVILLENPSIDIPF